MIIITKARLLSRSMEPEGSNGTMGNNIGENWSKMLLMASEAMSGRMEGSIKVNGPTMSSMVLVCLAGQTTGNILAISAISWRTVMGSISLRTGEFIKGIGKIIKETA